MKASKFLKGTGIAAAAMLLPMSQAAMAEGTWGISGWINEGITYLDDGTDTAIGQISDNGTTLGSRITLNGTYEPENTGLKTGFEFILEPGTQLGDQPLIGLTVDKLDSSDGFASDIGLLSHNIFIGGDWGKVTIGKQSMPTDNIAVLADPSLTIWSGISPIFRFQGVALRNSDGTTAGGLGWGAFAQCYGLDGLGIGIDCNGIYRNGVRYDLPAFGPVSIAVGWANDDIYDVALKYAGEFGDFKVNANAGYSEDKNAMAAGGMIGSQELMQFQAGIMHVPTGLFGVATYTNEQLDAADVKAAGSDDTDAYYFKFGIRKAFSNIGDSAFYVDYGSYNDQYGVIAGVTGSELERFSLVAEQYFGPRLVIYGKYEELSLDVSGTNAYDDVEDLEAFTLGVTYFF